MVPHPLTLAPRYFTTALLFQNGALQRRNWLPAHSKSGLDSSLIPQSRETSLSLLLQLMTLTVPINQKNDNQILFSEIVFVNHCYYNNSIIKNPNYITIHMPQRTSKILLVRLTANRNALLFLIRVTSFACYTV